MNNSVPLSDRKFYLCPISTTAAKLDYICTLSMGKVDNTPSRYTQARVLSLRTSQLDNMFLRTKRIDLSTINFDHNSTSELFFRF